MAASISSSVSSSAPIDFKLINSVEDATNGISVAVERCPLCFSSKRAFYCSQCLNKGDFVRTNQADVEAGLEFGPGSGIGKINRPRERYCDKVQLWNKLKVEKLMILNRIREKLKDINDLEGKKTELLLSHARIAEQKKSLRDQGKLIFKEKEDLNGWKTEILRRKQRCQKYHDKKERIKKKILSAVESCGQKHAELKDTYSELQELRRDHVEKLVEHIFPITSIAAKSMDPNETEGDPLSELADAQQMSFIQGRWVYTDSDAEEQYQIVEPTLPGNGDYSRYRLLLLDNRENTSASASEAEGLHGNPVLRIGAALAYTAQLACVLSQILDVNLPKPVTFRDFCNPDMTEKQLVRVVRRLNHKVLQLCFSQNVEAADLNPILTIQNILQLLKAPDCGRYGPYEVHTDVLEAVHHDHEQPEESDQDASDHDEMDAAGADWERVPGSLPEADPYSSGGSAISSDSSQSSTITVAGGLMSSAVASVASLWRTATKTDK